jgi:DNA polymerase beta
MKNNLIISEFQRLIAFIEDETNKLVNIKEKTANKFRLKQLTNVLNIIKKYPDEITIDNLGNLKNISGIGKGSIDRIIEILTNGKLKELGNYVDTNIEKKKILSELENVVGIGPSIALELFDKGVISVKDLIKKIKKNEIEVNDKIELGLKYYGKFEGNIPRKEIDKIYKIFVDIIKKLNKKENLNSEYIFDFCGSYRREKPTSGDIDVLITKKGNIDDKINYLGNIIKILKEPIIKNNNMPLLIDDMTDKNIHTKYMGFLKYKDNPARRIDIRFVPYINYYSALVYFTGSADLNKQMRIIAKSKKLKLSEYGLFNEKGEMLPINSERDIFDILEMEYLLPRLR